MSRKEFLGNEASQVDAMAAMGMSLKDLQEALPEGGLHGSGGWKWSPEPFKLTRVEAKEIMSLGHPLARFQQACDGLYRRSAAGKLPLWLSELLDAGKPHWLVQVQRHEKLTHQFPRVIRPDLILTESGFSMTELDSVPGGIGVTAWLSQAYAKAGYAVLGGADGMLDGFRSLMPQGGKILISQESGDYRSEMEWLSRQLGNTWQVASAENDVPTDEAAYRFFELFDWSSISGILELADFAKITPPLKPHLEDKLWLALLWNPALKPLWEQVLRGSHLQRLRAIVPFGWVVDPTELPPHAALPRLNVNSWKEVAAFSQKERQMVLKISGFHESAWGSRGVYIGHDLPAHEWAELLEQALSQAASHPWIAQEFKEGRKVNHPIFREDGSVGQMEGRVRLCPYFFTDDQNETQFGGCLATIVPVDKKKIHGMSEGILVPCVVE